MRRLHLIELHDQPWFPAPLRDALTDLLRTTADTLRIYTPVLPALLDAIEGSGTDEVVDLCSGGGGPWPGLVGQLPASYRRRLRITLTDRFPNREAFRRAEARAERAGAMIRGRTESLDAMDAPPELRGMRTLFASFHHFRPEDAARILQDAVDKGVPIGIFEMTERRLPTIAFVALTAPLGAAVGLPLAGLTPLRALATFVVPVLPLVLGIDGVVSCLRTYDEAELREMVDGLRGSERYEWQIGRVRAPFRPLPITYLIGRPRPA